MKSIDIACPACGQRPVKGIQPSLRGVYCQCESCHHMWQQQGLRLTRTGMSSGFGRRLDDRDRAAAETAGRQAQVESRCAYCDAPEEAGHVCATELLKRRILELEAENAHLRQSALSFGDLAERLNRRNTPDRQSKS